MDIKYIIFDLSEMDKINQDEVISFRIGKTKGIVKYLDEIPPSVQSLETKSEEYTNLELFPILETDEWIITNINDNEIVSGSLTL
ncbi:hypothetical protein UFOVP185_46 [uncultured Caudovirales phage]|uniref:Uncharacterized protein n=1 Tax=uncultured Caudovirales phage TaxID=2100421 RepID=A0A6J7WH26_9CAUD|nr:hypothetical protein UFOVP185_46 [uncultured Caudovirales phage]